MTVQISDIQLPRLITWFNCFLGFAEIKKRIDRVSEKLDSIGFASPILNRQFEFHKTYLDLVIRNRMHRKINIHALENTRCLSIIAAIREADGILSDSGKKVLKSRLRDALSPDRDIRPLEHELRAFVHYRQAGYYVEFVELEGKEQFDLLVSKEERQFEVECKTFSENLGSAITIEESFGLFRTFREILQSPTSFSSGIITFEIENKLENLKLNPREILLDFIERAPAEKKYTDVSLTFEKKPMWDHWITNNNTDKILHEIQKQYEVKNPHFLIALSKKRAIMFCLLSKRRAQPVNGIIRRLKDAGSQLSTHRPGVIWAHMLGINESEFQELHSRSASNGKKPLDVIAYKLLESPKRNHVCRLRLSAESDAIKNNGYRHFLGNAARSFSMQGPAYDFTSRVSRFDTSITNV